MIFICLGTREYQFNRLLKKIDELVYAGLITESVMAQIGQSTYIPKNYHYKRFLAPEEFDKYQRQANLIISHGGTGALVGALKKEKQVIASPRLKKFGEHIDDHQTEVAGILDQEGYLRTVLDMDNLFDVINDIKDNPITKKYQKSSRVFDIINNFISKN